ncbi:hypothetical protein FNV43_RR25783 [Rhamnella rubrinervis]|uniref:Uncharacterized protein n=1 Tax=Rhamnella rubrinervis TaxID=2594499 RepID=A0A8K0GNP2_9ROSA|nr:hypothetical protein FNV43_RR25783 [Rhamnella rubrinervis]
MEFFSQDDVDCFKLFENTRKVAEAKYAEEPRNATVRIPLTHTNTYYMIDRNSEFCSLVRPVKFSGFFLLSESYKMGRSFARIVQFQRIEAAKAMINGNANTSYGFLTASLEDAKPYLDRASECYQNAVDEASELHKEIRECAAASSSKKKVNRNITLSRVHLILNSKELSYRCLYNSKSKKSGDAMDDIWGWIILVTSIIIWVGDLAKEQLEAIEALEG